MLQVLARLVDVRVFYPTYNNLYGSAERKVNKQLGIRSDTGIIAPRLMIMEVYSVG